MVCSLCSLSIQVAKKPWCIYGREFQLVLSLLPHTFHRRFCTQANSLSDKMMGHSHREGANGADSPVPEWAGLESHILGCTSYTHLQSSRVHATRSSHKLASSPCAQQKKQRSVLMLKHNLETIQSLFLLPQEFLRIDLAWCRLLVSFRTYFTHETYTYGCNFLKIKHERCHLDTSRLTYSHLNRSFCCFYWDNALISSYLGQTNSTSSFQHFLISETR